MRLSMSVWQVLAGLGVSHAALGAREAGRVKNVAIIGAGAAGSSAAYHLQQYAEEGNLPINITVFEKTDRIGGRTQTTDVFGDPSERVEVGASIFVSVNHILYNATQKFNLPIGEMSRASKGDITAIWDGESFVFESTNGSSMWMDITKLVWRYGTAPFTAMKLVQAVVGEFLKLYEEPYFPFESLTERVYELGLEKATGVTGEQFLSANKISAKFSREMLQSATRVNYASNLAYIHGLDTMVSFATDGAVSVDGGNWQIFAKMMEHSGAALYQNTSVTSITLNKSKSGSSRKYTIQTQTEGGADANAPASFDDVIIASPWQFSDINAGEGLLRHPIEEIPYTNLHVTLFATPLKLHAEYFGLSPGRKPPSNVYTTLSKDEPQKKGAEGVGSTGFYSISTLRTAKNPKSNKDEYVYKVFSPKPLTPEFLSGILGTKIPETFTTSAEASPISWYHPTSFNSYPIALPRVTFQDPVLGKGLYYTSGVESFISTMETSALMGMNVARLIADEMAGIERAVVKEARAEWLPQEDFFASVDDELLGGHEL